MNIKQHRRLCGRIYDIYCSIPGPAAGSQSSSFSGYVSACRDYQFVNTLIKQSLSAACCYDAPDEVITEPLDDAEAYIERRGQEDWNVAGAGNMYVNPALTNWRGNGMKHNLTPHDLVHLKDAEAGTDHDQVTLKDGTRVKAEEVTLTDLERSQVCPKCEFQLLENEDKPCRVNCLRYGSYGVRFVRVEGERG